MAASLGPNIIKNSLAASLDAADRNSFLKYSLINMSNWAVGTGGVTGFNPNGNPASENQRFSGTNPWGQTDIIWGSFPSGNNNDDGGWNTDYFNIDKTKLYRFSVWVKRTSSTGGGTFYFGMYADGDGSRQMDNSTVNTNSYWNCTGAGGLTQDVWYLYVGHVYPYDTTYTGKHPDTGYYFANNPTKQGDVNLCNIGTGELKWSSNSTQAVHRTYHYYCADSTTRLQFYDPRVDAIDGTEPSISELVNRSPIQLKDMCGNNIITTFINGAAISNGILSLDGVNDYATITFNSVFNVTSSPFSVSIWHRNNNSGTGYNGIITADNTGDTTWKIIKDTGEQFYKVRVYNTIIAFPAYTVGRFHNYAFTKSGTNLITYFDSVAGSSSSSCGDPVSFSNNLALGSYRLADAQAGSYLLPQSYGNILFYNRELTASEILDNYNSTKSRFGL